MAENLGRGGTGQGTPAGPGELPDARTRLRAMVVYGQIVSGVYIMLGTLGLLNTRAHFGADEGMELLGVLSVTAASSLIYLLLGLAGPAALTRARSARRYLLFLAVLFGAWALLGLILNGAANDLFTGNAATVALHAATALGAAFLVWWSDRRPPPEDAAVGPATAPEIEQPPTPYIGE